MDIGQAPLGETKNRGSIQTQEQCRTIVEVIENFLRVGLKEKFIDKNIILIITATDCYFLTSCFIYSIVFEYLLQSWERGVITLVL